jgi:hypothetical protein
MVFAKSHVDVAELKSIYLFIFNMFIKGRGVSFKLITFCFRKLGT